MEGEEIPCSFANVSSRILLSSSVAFFDDDAVRDQQAGVLTAIANRSASG